jgi:hypothetical protein
MTGPRFFCVRGVDSFFVLSYLAPCIERMFIPALLVGVDMRPEQSGHAAWLGRQCGVGFHIGTQPTGTKKGRSQNIPVGAPTSDTGMPDAMTTTRRLPR